MLCDEWGEKNMKRIGILLKTSLLRRIVRKKKVNEKARLYVKYGKKNGLRPVLFDIHGVDLKKKRVRGYKWSASKKRYVSVTSPLPRVVHNRVYTRSPKIKALSRHLGRRLFNPPEINRSKLWMDHLLRKNAKLRPHLPVSRRLRRRNFKLVKRYPHVFIKPVVGSLGRKIIRVQSVGKKRFIFQPARGKKQVISRARLKKKFKKRHLFNGDFFVQQGITLARYHRRPYDLRVSVQKGGKGRWRISGITAKVAGKGKNLTNLSQNGKAVPVSVVLSHSFPRQNKKGILRRVRGLALEVCRTLEKTYPAFADAGLDIGIDKKGHPWLIEVNFRDLRYSFHSAGEYKMFHNTYHRPIKYAKYLLS